MIRSKFLKKHRLSNATPDTPLAGYMRIRELLGGLSELFSCEFAEEVEMVCETESSDLIFVDPGALAYFIKRLICELYGREKLRITAHIKDSRLIFRFSSESLLPQLLCTVPNIIPHAKQAGFHTITDKSGITLSTGVEPYHSFFLHAYDSGKWWRTLVQIFFEPEIGEVK